MKTLKIVDTTLRDGEQRAGIAFSTAAKLQIAKALDDCAVYPVYQIEAGTPVISAEEREAVREIKALGLRARISTWNRMHERDIEASLSCGADVLHICVPTSGLHIADKLGKDHDWVCAQMERCIAYAKSGGAAVTIGFEDASRTPLAFILQISMLAKACGAAWIRYSDTVGVLTPAATSAAVAQILRCGLPVGVHTHNDFGMAVANTVAAIEAGAEYADTTIGGIGERSGNCDLLHLLYALGKALPGISGMPDAENVKKLRDILNVVTNLAIIRT